MKPDSIHYSLNRVLSHNKTFNFVISAREAGKTTATWLYAYKQLVTKNKTTVVLRRRIADITDTYVSDIENVINKFMDEPIELVFKRGGIKEGIVDIQIKKDGELTPFIRVIALSNPMMRIKSLMFPNLGLMIFDEFICNLRLGEKYLQNEIFRFKEIFNTFYREAENGLRVIFLGNPYSLYNPYFSWIGVSTKKLYPGAFVTGANWVVECYQLSDELKQFILDRNPLYRFDDAYTSYAFDGRAVNDTQIQVMENKPENFQLRYVFYIDNKQLCFYHNMSDELPISYWVTIDNDYRSIRRNILTFDFNSLVEGTVLFTREDRKALECLRNAFKHRRIGFRTIEESYLFEQIYELI